MKTIPLGVAAVLVIVIGAAIVAFVQNNREGNSMFRSVLQRNGAGSFPSLSGATEWLNSEPLTPASLHGKVVLVNFWTYTCINWLRQLPYVRAWAEKYEEQGLVVLGIHTPEFGFEQDLDNVRREVSDLSVEYPVAVDNEYAVWDAFANQYWPALYLIDSQGQIRYHHFGEGNYEESERMIQKLLAEAGSGDVSQDLVTVDAPGVEAAADWDSLHSGENYLGFDRTQNFASPRTSPLGESHVYAAPPQVFLNGWALIGDWTIEHQLIRLNQVNGRILYRFHARDLHLVMGPTTPGASVRFRVTIDGEAPGAAHGADVDDQGIGTVSEQRLYQLIRQPNAIGERQFEIEFLDAGIEAFAFTFG